MLLWLWIALVQYCSQGHFLNINVWIKHHSIRIKISLLVTNMQFTISPGQMCSELNPKYHSLYEPAFQLECELEQNHSISLPIQQQIIQKHFH